MYVFTTYLKTLEHASEIWSCFDISYEMFLVHCLLLLLSVALQIIIFVNINVSYRSIS